MRAQYVYENLNFERTGNPIKAIGAGILNGLDLGNLSHKIVELAIEKDIDLVKYLTDGKYTLSDMDEFMIPYKHGADIYKKYKRPPYTSYKLSDDFKESFEEGVKNKLQIDPSSYGNIYLTTGSLETYLDSLYRKELEATGKAPKGMYKQGLWYTSLK